MSVMAPKPKKPRTSEIYLWRIAKGWEQSEMAKELGVSVATVRRLETAKRLTKRYQRAFNDLKAENP